MVTKTTDISSFRQLNEFANCLARELSNRLEGYQGEPLLVGLRGALGSGKTTFVKSLVKALGGEGENVSSPSYVLEQRYEIGEGRVVSHWDLYRLQQLPDEVLYGDDPAVILAVVEWPDKFGRLMEALDLVLNFELVSLESMKRTAAVTWQA